MEPTVLETALIAVKTDLLAGVAVAIPVALAIMAALFVPRKAVQFFKGLAK
jgi:hypothetical protein